MSRGNLFMGYARGKVGSVVLSRSKGQQIARAHNDKPKNPRTKAQMMQRSIFASAVKFFAQGKQAFFPFAFENKGMKQSDYNAFVSENTARGIHISQAAYDERTYPVLAPWMMTKGALEQPTLTFVADAGGYTLAAPSLSETSNFGDFSRNMINEYGYTEGDIFTVALITAYGSTAENTPSIEPEKRNQIVWKIAQERLDSASTAALASKFNGMITADVGQLLISSEAGSSDIEGCVICISRNTPTGLKVSTAEVVLNTAATTAYEAAKDAAYINQVLQSWDASQTPILKGGLSE